MMNFAKQLLLVVLVAVIGTGCAGAQVRAEIAQLQAENASLKDRVEAREATRPPAPRQPASPVAVMPPPAQPEVSGPPENWAWLHQPPVACETGPFAVRLKNRTDAYLKVFVNGKELVVRGAGGVLPHLPPHATAYVCLAHLGRNTFAGVKYLPRMGALQEVGSFQFSRTFRPNAVNGAGNFNEVVLDDYWTSMQLN